MLRVGACDEYASDQCLMLCVFLAGVHAAGSMAGRKCIERRAARRNAVEQWQLSSMVAAPAAVRLPVF